MFLDPIQKRALSRFVHLEAVYLEALLYYECTFVSWTLQWSLLVSFQFYPLQKVMRRCSTLKGTFIINDFLRKFHFSDQRIWRNTWAKELEHRNCIMSHWRHMMVDGAEFWINCQWLIILNRFSCWQLIWNLVPSTTVWRQCDIPIWIACE